MVERVTTGIKGIDTILRGGFPRGSNILITGPPGSGKSVFAQQYIGKSCESGYKSIYTAIDDSPEDIKANMSIFGFNIPQLEKKKILHFIDAYSWRLGVESSENHSVDTLVDLSKLNIELDKIRTELGYFLKGKPGSIAIDSISTLIMYSNANTVFKFLQVLGARSKAVGATTIYTMESGVHDSKVMSSINYIMDGVIELKMDEEHRYMKIQKMKFTDHPRAWVKYKIGDKGIQMEKFQVLFSESENNAE